MSQQEDKLAAMIRAGPNARYTVKVLVLDRFTDITTARQLMYPWADIAEALGYPRQSWKTLSAAYKRVDAGLKAGRLVKPKPAPYAPARKEPSTESRTPRATKGEGEVDWEALARKNKAEAADINWKG